MRNIRPEANSAMLVRGCDTHGLLDLEAHPLFDGKEEVGDAGNSWESIIQRVGIDPNE